MIYLIIASLIWAFSFGLIKTQLASLDPIAVSSVRLLLAVLVFTPFILRN
ncbi:EamA family transporter, partial [bacterium]|nr:EamA family transporter [bacterium]